MISDFRVRDDSEPISVDLCVIGSGAAGISIARHFAGSRVRVALLESGGYGYDSEVQALYEGYSVGMPYFKKLDECRTRRFGGSTNCWGGMCTPMTEIDYKKRSWVPYSGWPIDIGEMETYMRRAHALCGIGPYGYDGTVWEALGSQALPFRPELLSSHFWQMNNRLGNRQVRFAKKFHADLQQARNVHVYLHANVVGLMLDPNLRRVSWVRTKTLDGRLGRVSASVFVLACGGIENPRMLLVSDEQMPKGIGNDRDLVGRFFMEHLHTPCATVKPPKSGSALINYARWWELDRSHARPGITLSPTAQEKYQTLNASVSVDPEYDESYIWRAAKDVWIDVVSRTITPRTLRRLLRMVSQPHVMLPDTYRRIRYGTQPMGVPENYVLYARAEQSPNPESRIRLVEEEDQTGLRKVVLDWRTCAVDRRSFGVLVAGVRAEFTRLGLGQVKEQNWIRDEGWPNTLVGGPHHMGTTRMSDDPSMGVVDRNAKVHGLDGLYIAGSSVFPTGGHANATLTLLATTLRLCDHLDTVLPRTSRAI